jgi:hypothetical protein
MRIEHGGIQSRTLAWLIYTHFRRNRTRTQPPATTQTVGGAFEITCPPSQQLGGPCGYTFSLYASCSAQALTATVITALANHITCPQSCTFGKPAALQHKYCMHSRTAANRLSERQLTQATICLRTAHSLTIRTCEQKVSVSSQLAPTSHPTTQMTHRPYSSPAASPTHPAVSTGPAEPCGTSPARAVRTPLAHRRARCGACRSLQTRGAGGSAGRTGPRR